MSQKILKPTRRDFLKYGLSGAAVLSTAAYSNIAIANNIPRHHLINIVRRGGWDSLWFHNAVPLSEIQDIVETSRLLVSSQSFVNNSGNILAPYADVYKNALKGQWTQRFPDSNIFYHPDGQTTLGPGLNFMNTSDLQEMCIWRGITSEGGHDLGNQILQMGALGGNYPSFSAGVATYASKAGINRKLQYVQIAANSVELCTQTGEFSEHVQPINLPNLGTWQNITSSSTSYLTNAKRRQLVDQAVESLSKVVSENTSTNASTQNVFSSFLNSFIGGNSISGSNFATSTEFLSIFEAYKSEIRSIVNNHIFKTTWFSSSGATDIVATNGYVDQLSFRFALAEFLVVKDLSTVVDILVPGEADFHNNANRDALFHLGLYAAYTILVRRLKKTELTPGASALEYTTVVMHSEFERHPIISHLDESSKLTPGADHWGPATSIWLAGKGVNKGKVIGDFKRGTSSSKFGSSSYNAFKPYYALPVDKSSGQVSLSGIFPHIKNLNPTILAIFGASGYSKLNGINPFTPVTKL
ncbi:MAG: DUF1501 domain-containing protein [Pseudobdellovibrio sp.]